MIALTSTRLAGVPEPEPVWLTPCADDVAPIEGSPSAAQMNAALVADILRVLHGKLARLRAADAARGRGVTGRAMRRAVEGCVELITFAAAFPLLLALVSNGLMWLSNFIDSLIRLAEDRPASQHRALMAHVLATLVRLAQYLDNRRATLAARRIVPICPRLRTLPVRQAWANAPPDVDASTFRPLLYR